MTVEIIRGLRFIIFNSQVSDYLLSVGPGDPPSWL